MAGNFKVLYLCDFNLNRNSGKDRATRQKLAALRGQVDELTIVSNPFRSQALRFFSIVFLDVKALFCLLFNRPDFFISRGYAGGIAMFMADFLSVRTVREIHADALEELSLLPFSGLKLFGVKFLAKLAHKLDVSAEIRIFNHPDLMKSYRERGLAGEHDFFVYNGYAPDERSYLSKAQAREKFGFGDDERILVFIGAASKWHGVEYLVKLQREFDERGENIKVVFGGGDVSGFDKDGRCINFSPLDDQDCADLVRASDFCLLPVKNNRVSPGSPLKLYDYIVNERFVFAQSETNGYSDEVDRFSIGVSVDFTNTELACSKILEAFEKDWPEKYPECKASWSDRMGQWISGLTSYSG